jgi:hypothetical protein
MIDIVLECTDHIDFKPHPEGIHPAVCVDVMDLGPMPSEYQGQRRVAPKVKLVFETEQQTDDGKRCTVTRSFTVSLHKKASLLQFLGKWRGRPLVPGDSVALAKLIGACCTLVISHQKNREGKVYASIDAVSKPTRKVTPSGNYDPDAALRRFLDWKAKQIASGAMPVSEVGGQSSEAGGRRLEAGGQGSEVGGQGEGTPNAAAQRQTEPAPAEPAPAFDPDVPF